MLHVPTTSILVPIESIQFLFNIHVRNARVPLPAILLSVHASRRFLTPRAAGMHRNLVSILCHSLSCSQPQKLELATHVVAQSQRGRGEADKQASKASRPAVRAATPRPGTPARHNRHLRLCSCAMLSSAMQAGREDRDDLEVGCSVHGGEGEGVGAKGRREIVAMSGDGRGDPSPALPARTKR